MAARIQPDRLMCEYLINPQGVDVLQPRLSWVVKSDQRAQVQTAYQILVADTVEALEANRGTLWDSGRVDSADSVHIVYQGTPLHSGLLCWWKVRVWDGTGHVSPYSAPATWQMGLLEPRDWQAQWIGLDVAPEPDLQMNPAVYLRRAFSLEKPVQHATLYATARGVYQAFLNGRRVGDVELAPGWTDYAKHIQYQAYDVTGMLQHTEDQAVENVLGVILGDGWYSGYVGMGGRANYGPYPRALLQLVVEHPDGSVTMIATDEEWRATTGPICYSDLLMGERYDARLEMSGWAGGMDTAAAFEVGAWQPVLVESLGEVPLVGERSQPIRVTEEVEACSVTEHKPGVWIFDLGQNMVGWVRLRVKGEAGTEICLRYAEILEEDGRLHTANLRSARATDTYIIKGEGVEVFEPHFTYHGFRYVEVTGYPGKPTLDMITGRVLHNDMPYTGEFECSHPLVNQLWENILWGQRGNFVSVPTDCPQRDERLGWMGDAQAFARTASFNMNVAAFFTKWMMDVVDAQSPEGGFPDVAPQVTIKTNGAPAWGDAGIIVPWTVYRVYGDTAIIKEHYAAMQRWMAYIQDANPDFLRTKRLNNNYGDWVSLERAASSELVATAYWAYCAQLMAEMAEAIGYYADAGQYQVLFEEIRQAFITAYVHPDGLIEGDTQTGYVLALFMDLLPESLRGPAAERLVKALERRDGHLATGFLGTIYLCSVLAETGHLDVAYQLLTNETYPSWLYTVLQGGTTIWERWNGYTEEQGIHDPGMNSFNHYAFGAIGAWLYRVVGGINAGLPGYQHIVLRPRPSVIFQYAKVGYESIRGRIASAWRWEGERVHCKVTVPANTTATLYLPTSKPHAVREGDGLASEAKGVRFVKYEQEEAVFALGSGEYHFTFDAGEV